MTTRIENPHRHAVAAAHGLAPTPPPPGRSPAMPKSPPKPIPAYVAATNAHDADAVAACFAETAVVHDEGRERRGFAGVREWAAETIGKYKHRLVVLGLAKAKGRTTATMRIAGDFPGSPIEVDFAFTIEGGKITALEIG